MTDEESPPMQFQTVTMAEILLEQDLVIEAAEILDQLINNGIDDPRARDLATRIANRQRTGEPRQRPNDKLGKDLVELALNDQAVCISWELTDHGLALAKRKVRYSGEQILRLFTASSGIRGVRKSTKDFELEHRAATMIIEGAPTAAVHVAAVGFLGRNGAFVPLASSEPLWSPS